MWDEHQHHDEHGHAHRHDTSVTSFCIRYDQPFTWTSFSQCMEVLATLRGPDLFRVKGLVNVIGHKGPLIVQGVQHLFHPPIELEAWPTGDQQTRIVFITRGISETMIRNLFSAITTVAAAAA